MNAPVAAAFARLDVWESSWCVRLNALSVYPAVRRYFAAVSRLGDGAAWYALILLLLPF